MVPRGGFCSDAIKEQFFGSPKKLSVKSCYKQWNGKVQLMLKLLHGTIDANKEPLCLRVYINKSSVHCYFIMPILQFLSTLNVCFDWWTRRDATVSSTD